MNDLRGGRKNLNAEIVRAVLKGGERGPKRDAVLLNSAAALMVVGRAPTLNSAWRLAESHIDSGAALEKLQQLSSP